MAENQASTEGPSSSDPLIPTPIIGRSNPLSDHPLLPPDIEEQFNRLMQTVQVLSAHFLGENALPAPAESVRERGARRIKKFQRAGGDERTGGNGTGEEMVGNAPAETAGDLPEGGSEEPDGLARNKHIAWPQKIGAGNPLSSGWTAPHWWQFEPETRFRLGALAFGLLLLGLGFLLGHSTASPSSTRNGKFGRATDGLFDPTELSEQAFLTANEALHEEHTGNAEAARKLYETAVDKHVALPGTNYRLALLALQRNDRLEAEQRLERSTLDGEEIADCCYLLARLAADSGDLDEEASEFERATHARPLDGKYFFFYAETLRRQGKPQAAIVAFEQALDRPYTAASGDLYLFKERLAKIEYGRDDSFNAELAAHLKQEMIGGDWLLLAAAQDLDHQAFTAAAEHLRQAGNRLPSSLYADLTHDYFFQAQAKRSELTGLLNRVATPMISSAGPTVLDPASWAPERGDPATWPSPGSRAGH